MQGGGPPVRRSEKATKAASKPKMPLGFSGPAGLFWLSSGHTGRNDPGIEAVMAFPERFSNLPDYAFPRLR
jgi:hypothetical protein